MILACDVTPFLGGGFPTGVTHDAKSRGVEWNGIFFACERSAFICHVYVCVCVYKTSTHMTQVTAKSVWMCSKRKEKFHS